LVRKLRTVPRAEIPNLGVKIIAISGLSAHRQAALDAGARVFLTKPYLLEDLLISLYDLIRDRQS